MGRPDVCAACLVEFDELLATSDLVSVNSRLDPSTHHLLDAAALARMKPGAYLVNTSRGGVVDQAALVEALRSGHLGGAALDVLEREPISQDDPLLSLPNVVLTPHAACYSRESLAEMKRRAAGAITAALADHGPWARYDRAWHRRVAPPSATGSRWSRVGSGLHANKVHRDKAKLDRSGRTALTA